MTIARKIQNPPEAGSSSQYVVRVVLMGRTSIEAREKNDSFTTFISFIFCLLS